MSWFHTPNSKGLMMVFLRSAIATFLIAAYPLGTFAQPDDQADPDTERSLEVVIITAQKRSENL